MLTLCFLKKEMLTCNHGIGSNQKELMVSITDKSSSLITKPPMLGIQYVAFGTRNHWKLRAFTTKMLDMEPLETANIYY